MKITTSGPQSIGQVATYFKYGTLFLSPEEYQRESAWDIGQKQLLIDTIFRGMDIPKFYFWKIDQRTLVSHYPEGETKNLYRKLLDKQRTENDDPNPCLYEVVDGQQRIRTILEYMGNKPPSKDHYRGEWLEPFVSLSDTPMAKGRGYQKLNPEQQNRFDQTSLSVMVLEDATIAEIRDMFLRLQNGTPLNAQQKRDALGSDIGARARELSELPFFLNSVAFGNEVGDHRRVSSQMLLLEYRGRIAPCTSQRLDKFYQEYKSNKLDAGLVKRVKQVVTLLGAAFPAKSHHLNRSYALSLYWALARVLDLYKIADADLPKIKSNFEKLNLTRLEAGQRGYANKPSDEIYEELSLSMSHGTDGTEQIEARHHILMQYLFEGIDLTPLPNTDPKRAFSYEEKLILHHLAGEKCQFALLGRVCGRAIAFENAAIDHINPWSRGGRTELSNGRYVSSSCNIARGTRDDFNPQTECVLARMGPDAAE